MSKETCSNCYVKLAQPVSFCPSCERPTPHATDAERLDWDLKQWRSHVDRSVAAGMNPTGTAVGFGAGGSVAVASAPQPSPEVRQAPAPAVKPRIVPMPAPQSRFLRLLRAAAKPPEARVEAPAAPAPQPQPVVESPKPERAPKLKKVRREKKSRRSPGPAVERDRDNEFAYDRCATCSEKDWIVRYSRNDDETWNYWCVRCSRSFKTEVKLRHALKPLMSSGVVVGGLAAASLLLFR